MPADAVILVTSGAPENTAFGTGFVVHTGRGGSAYVVTCQHVVEDVGGKPHIGGLPADVVAPGRMPVLDLAVLRVHGLDAQPVRLAPLDASLAAGTRVEIRGFREDTGDFLRHPLPGHVGKLLEVESRDGRLRASTWDLEIDDPDWELRRGYSGSPVVDMQSGLVVGIATHSAMKGRRGRAISPSALAQIWPEMPLGLLVALSLHGTGRQGLARGSCPYPGLAHFTDEFAGVYFGRDRELDTAWDTLREHRLLVVAGAAAAGKSSFLTGGLLPRLRAVRTLGPRWRVEAIAGQGTPTRRLEARLPGLAARPEEAVAAVLARPETSYGDEEEELDERLLLVVDQLETKLLPTGADAQSSEGRRFLDLLERLQGVERCAILLAVREDFRDDLPGWLGADTHRVLRLEALEGEPLREAVVGPARAVGVEVAPELAQQIVTDAADHPARMVMAQAALRQMWEAVRDGRLTLKAYERLRRGHRRSGLARAIANLADDVLATLDERRSVIARRVFLRLVQPVPGKSAAIGRALPLADLVSAGDDPDEVRSVIDAFTEQSLLASMGAPGALGTRLVTLGHEALIHGWPEFEHWLRDHGPAEERRRRYEEKAREWVRLERSGGLLDEPALDDARTWLAGPEADVVGHSPDLAALVKASEAALAETARAKAEANASELARSSADLLDRDPALSLLLAVEAVEIGGAAGVGPVPRVEDTLRAALGRSPARVRLSGPEARLVAHRPASDGAQAVLLVSEGGVVSLWEPGTGRRLQPLGDGGAEDKAVHAAWSGAGDRLVVALDDGRVLVHDMPSGRCAAMLRVGARVAGVAFDADGHHMAVAAHDGRVSVWLWADSPSEPLFVLDAHEGPALSVAWSEAWLASGGEDGTARVWQLPRDLTSRSAAARAAASRRVLYGHVNAVRAVAWRWTGPAEKGRPPPPPQLWTGGDDGTVQAWSAAGERQLRLLQFAPVSSLALGAAEGRTMVAVACGDDAVRVWDAATGSLLAKPRLPGASLRSLSFDTRGRRLAVGGTGSGPALLLPFPSGEEDAIVTGWGALNAARYGSDRFQVATASSGDRSGVLRTPFVTLWDMRSGKVAKQRDLSSVDVAWSADGGCLVAVGDGSAVWEVEGLGSWLPLKAASSYLARAAFSPSGRHVAVAGHYQPSIYVADAATGKQVGMLKGHTDGIAGLAWGGAAAEVLVSGGDDHVVLLWHAGFDGHTLSFAPPTRLGEHRGKVTAVAIDAAAARAASVGADRSLCVWDLASCHRLYEATDAHGGMIADVAWSPDGSAIATAGLDGTVRLWDAARGKLRCTLGSDGYPRKSVSFSPCGTRLIAACQDGRIREYLAIVGDLVAAARLTAGRDLTQEERQAYRITGQTGA